MGWSGEKGGEVTIDRPGQEVLERSSVVLSPWSRDSLADTADRLIELRFCVSLPAQGTCLLISR